MMLPAAGARRRHGRNHVRPDHADEMNEIAGDLVAAPFLERLVEAEREAEVDGAGEVLLGAVEAVERGQFLGPQNAERFEDFGADLVLAAVAARRRRQGRAIAHPSIQLHEQPVVLVVGMRVRVHVDAGVGEMAQREAERHMALLLVDGHDAHLCADTETNGGNETGGGEKRASHNVILPERPGVYQLWPRISS